MDRKLVGQHLVGVYRFEKAHLAKSHVRRRLSPVQTDEPEAQSILEQAWCGEIAHNGNAGRWWLRVAGAELDLREQAVLLGRPAARERDTPTALGLPTWGGLHVMLIDGATDLALAELDATTVPTDSTGEGNAYWMGFGPTNVGCWRLAAAVQLGDHEHAAAIAEGLHPELHPQPGSQALYWVHYGRALSRLLGRRDDAVRALRRAELISPHQVQRDPLARDILGELLARAHRDSPVGRELRRMAARAGLPM